jgi:hypothetical protein
MRDGLGSITAFRKSKAQLIRGLLPFHSNSDILTSGTELNTTSIATWGGDGNCVHMSELPG